MAHIFHVTSRHAPQSPGETTVITQLTRYLAAQQVPTTVLAAGQATTSLPAGVELVEFPLLPWGKTWRFPRHLADYLVRISGNSGNVLHLHGVWLGPQWLAARIAHRHHLPAILTAHGMLEPWHWQDGRLRRLKKLAYWYSLAYPAFRHLPLIHAITPMERDHLARHFPGQRLEVIPNAIDLQEMAASPGSGETAGNVAPAEPYLLFLSRLHAKKGVEVLLAAFARARKKRTFRLVIAGPDNTPVYGARLRAQAKALGVEREVTFLGPVFGPEKGRLFRQAWAFCLPSHSEVVGLVNLEAAAAGVPVITTFETGLDDWEEGGGLLVHPQVEDLARVLEQVCSWSDSERQQRGRRMRQWVERRYSWEVVGPLWLQLYEEIAVKGYRGK